MRAILSNWRYLLLLEIIIILVIKISLIIVLSHLCFAHPIESELTASKMAQHFLK